MEKCANGLALAPSLPSPFLPPLYTPHTHNHTHILLKPNGILWNNFSPQWNINGHHTCHRGCWWHWLAEFATVTLVTFNRPVCKKIRQHLIWDSSSNSFGWWWWGCGGDGRTLCECTRIRLAAISAWRRLWFNGFWVVVVGQARTDKAQHDGLAEEVQVPPPWPHMPFVPCNTCI